nr:MAG TPA: hypothetical protein [Caudoviricetes sp.]DAO47095.1 MAG TPA: hypothetical protein [Caudoviricetes sp.]
MPPMLSSILNVARRLVSFEPGILSIAYGSRYE